MIGTLFLLLGMSAAYAQSGSYSGGSSGSSYDTYSNYGQQGQQQMQQQQMPSQGQQQSSVPSDCSHLSQQEQQFASQLSEMHRTMFCRHFSVSQRIEAMTIASTSAQGLAGSQKKITPDEAVEAVMAGARQNQNGNGQPSGSGQQTSPYGGSYSSPNSSSSSSNPYRGY